MAHTVSTQLVATDLNSLAFKEAREIHLGKNRQTGPNVEFMKASAEYSVDENHRVIIKVLDKSGKVMMQLPPEEYLVMSKILRETENILLKEA